MLIAMMSHSFQIINVGISYIIGLHNLEILGSRRLGVEIPSN